MKTFASPDNQFAAVVPNDHGGIGDILFQRILDSTEFRSAIDFVDYTIIPPGSTIGKHEHHGNEELYFIASGNPLMRVNGEEARLHRGSLSIVRDGEWHELINDSSQDVELLVIQAGLFR